MIRAILEFVPSAARSLAWFARATARVRSSEMVPTAESASDSAIRSNTAALRAFLRATFATLSFAGVVAWAMAPALAAPHAGDVAAPFTLPKDTGGTISLAQFKGKPLYLNFFASWCGPCNDEATTVGALYRKFHKRGLATIGIDEQEEKSKALGFAQKYKWPFAVALDDGNMGKDYGAIALPVHVFIDKHGKISEYRLGEMDRADVEAAIKKIL